MANILPTLLACATCGPCAFDEDEDFSISSSWMIDPQNPVRSAEGRTDESSDDTADGVDAIEVAIDPIIGVDIMVVPATSTRGLMMMNDDDAAVEDKTTMMIMGGGSSLKRKASDTTSTSSPTTSVADHQLSPSQATTATAATTTADSSPSASSSSAGLFPPEDIAALVTTSNRVPESLERSTHPSQRSSCDDGSGDDDRRDKTTSPLSLSTNNSTPSVIGLAPPPSPIRLRRWGLRPVSSSMNHDHLDHPPAINTTNNTNNNNNGRNASAAMSPPPWPWSVEISPQRQVHQQQKQHHPPSNNTHRGCSASSNHCHQFSSLSFGDNDLKMLTGCIDNMDSSPKDSSLDNFNNNSNKDDTAVETVNVTLLVDKHDRIDHLSTTTTTMTAADAANNQSNDMIFSSPCKEDEYTKLLSSPKASTPYLGSGDDDNSLLLKTPRLDMARSNSFTITPSRPSSSTSNIMSLVDVDNRGQHQQGSIPPPPHHRDDSHVSFNTSPTSLHLGDNDSLILKTPRQSPTSLHHHRHDSRGSTLFNTSPLSLLHRRDDSRTTFNTSPTSLNLNLTDMYSSIDIDNFFDDLVADSEMSPIATKPTTGSGDQGIIVGGSNTRQIQHQSQQAMNSNTVSSPTLYHHHARSNSLQMIKNDHTFLSGGLTSPLVEFEVDCSHQYGTYHPTNTPPIQPFHVDYPSLTISSTTTTAAAEVASNRTGGGDSSCTPNNRRSTKKVKRTDDRLTSSDPLPRGSSSKTTKKATTSRKRSLPMPLLELKSSSSFPPAFPQGSITPSQGTLEMYDNELYRKLRDAPFQPSITSSSSSNHLPRPLVPPNVTGNRLIVLHGPSESRDDHEIDECVSYKTYAFYKYLREIYPALDGCTYLLPGLQQHGERERGRSSRNTNEECGDTNNNVLKNNLGSSGTMNISKVGSFVLGHTPGMSKSEKSKLSKSDLIIARRRVVCAIYAFGGTISRRRQQSSKQQQNHKADSNSNTMSIFRTRNDDTTTSTTTNQQSSGIFRSRNNEDTKASSNNPTSKHELIRNNSIIRRQRYENKLQQQYFEHGNHLSWDVQSNLPLTLNGARTFDDDDMMIGQSSSNLSEGGTTKKSSSRKNRCKLCGQIKIGHICPYASSLQRNIGIMVYPSVNAHVADEPGRLSSALCEMNNFISMKNNGSFSESYDMFMEDNSGGATAVVVRAPRQCVAKGSIVRQKSLIASTTITCSTTDRERNVEDSTTDLLFQPKMEITVDQYRSITPRDTSATSHRDYTYPQVPLTFNQRKSSSDVLFSLSKLVPKLTEECALVLTEARKRDQWDLAVAELMTQVLCVLHCSPSKDYTLEGLKRYLLMLGIVC